MAGPLIFELPFDLIVMGRTYPPIPPDPAVLRALSFFPLFLIELTTLSLLFVSPLFEITKYTLYGLAGMFFVFAIWGFLSFSFAYTAVPHLECSRQSLSVCYGNSAIRAAKELRTGAWQTAEAQGARSAVELGRFWTRLTWGSPGNGWPSGY
jgi:hypothetical protein